LLPSRTHTRQHLLGAKVGGVDGRLRVQRRKVRQPWHAPRVVHVVAAPRRALRLQARLHGANARHHEAVLAGSGQKIKAPARKAFRGEQRRQGARQTMRTSGRGTNVREPIRCSAQLRAPTNTTRTAPHHHQQPKPQPPPPRPYLVGAKVVPKLVVAGGDHVWHAARDRLYLVHENVPMGHWRKASETNAHAVHMKAPLDRDTKRGSSHTHAS